MSLSVMPLLAREQNSRFLLNVDAPIAAVPQFSGYNLPDFYPLKSQESPGCSSSHVDLTTRTIRGIAEELRNAKLVCCGKVHEDAKADFSRTIQGASPNFENWNCEIRNLLGNLVCGHPEIIVRQLLTATYILQHLGCLEADRVTALENEIWDCKTALRALDSSSRNSYKQCSGPDAMSARKKVRLDAMKSEMAIGEQMLRIRDELLVHLDRILQVNFAVPAAVNGTTFERRNWQKTDNPLRPYRTTFAGVEMDIRMFDQIDPAIATMQQVRIEYGESVQDFLAKSTSSTVTRLMRGKLQGRPAFHMHDIKLSL